MNLARSTLLNPLVKRVPQAKPSFFIEFLLAITELNKTGIARRIRRIAIVDVVIKGRVDSLIDDSIVDSSGSIGRAAIGIRVVMVDLHDLLLLGRFLGRFSIVLG